MLKLADYFYHFFLDELKPDAGSSRTNKTNDLILWWYFVACTEGATAGSDNPGTFNKDIDKDKGTTDWLNNNELNFSIAWFVNSFNDVFFENDLYKWHIFPCGSCKSVWLLKQ